MEGEACVPEIDISRIYRSCGEDVEVVEEVPADPVVEPRCPFPVVDGGSVVRVC